MVRLISEDVERMAADVGRLEQQAQSVKEELSAAWGRVNASEDGKAIVALSDVAAEIGKEIYEKSLLVKAAVVSAYKADPTQNKHPVPWANVIEKSEVGIDASVLLEWAKENSPWFLMLNVPLVREVAPAAQKRGQEFPGVRVYTEPQAQWNTKGLAKLAEEVYGDDE